MWQMRKKGKSQEIYRVADDAKKKPKQREEKRRRERGRKRSFASHSDYYSKMDENLFKGPIVGWHSNFFNLN